MEWLAQLDHPRLSLVEKFGKQLLIHCCCCCCCWWLMATMMTTDVYHYEYSLWE